MPVETVTVRDALRTGAERLALREDLRENARQDVQQILEIATGLSRVQMLARPQGPLSAEDLARFNDLLRRRLLAEPIQYLRGTQEFYGRDFLVTADVLIPRPETEDIVAAVLERVPHRHSPVTIVDVGTGSGAIALTLALELPHSIVTAIDISEAALRVARQNAEALAARYDPTLTRRVRFLRGDLLGDVQKGTPFDFVVSNPPYIPLGESPTLHAQVREHEPHLALFGGADGNDIFRRLIGEAREMLKNGGFLVLETAGNNGVLHTLLSGWSDVASRVDLRGMQRVIVATRP